MSTPQSPDPKTVRVYDRPASADASPLSKMLIPIVIIIVIAVVALAVVHFVLHKI